MGLADDLLQQAGHLATYEGANPSQAALRRSISTAYYALFHLLAQDAAQRWQGSIAAVTGLERAFNHAAMRNSSNQFENPSWTDWRGNIEPVPAVLQRVAAAFIELQQDRHIADYNNHEEWTVTEVQLLLDTTAAAFEDWSAIRSHPMAGNYLLSMLLGKQR